MEIRVDWSLLIIFALVAFSLGAQVLPAWHPDWGAALSWAVAIISAVAFFASVLAHELSHALVGKTQGIPVRRITLFLFGGMAHMDKQPPSPKAEVLMAAIGPVVSIAIGVGASLLAAALIGPELVAELASDPEAALSSLTATETVLLWLGPINVMLGLFNLVPGFPLDGGRVFRAVAWWISGDMVRATRWASNAGRLVAATLMIVGVAMAFGVYIPVFGTGFGPGLWLVLIGWFLHKAAQVSYDQLLVRVTLRDVKVREVMRRRVDVVPPELTVDALMREHVMQSDQEAFPVVEGDRLVGIVGEHDAMAVPQARWATTPVREIMVTADRVSTVPPGEGVSDALKVLEEQRVPMLPVVEGGAFRGSLHGRDVFKWLTLHADELSHAA